MIRWPEKVTIISGRSFRSHTQGRTSLPLGSISGRGTARWRSCWMMECSGCTEYAEYSECTEYIGCSAYLVRWGGVSTLPEASMVSDQELYRRALISAQQRRSVHARCIHTPLCCSRRAPVATKPLGALPGHPVRSQCSIPGTTEKVLTLRAVCCSDEQRGPLMRMDSALTRLCRGAVVFASLLAGQQDRDVEYAHIAFSTSPLAAECRSRSTWPPQAYDRSGSCGGHQLSL